MATGAFAAGVAELEVLAARASVAVMCSEALWWRCHRRLVADALVVRGHAVEHLAPDGRTAPHALTPFARLGADGTLTYPRQEPLPG